VSALDKPSTLVSVIVVTHNRLEALKKTINSILSSSYENLEVIVIDDFSNDGTYEYLLSHYPSITVVRTPREVLPALSREIGYRLSKGEYLMFIDDDCILLKDTIGELVRLVSSDPSIGVVGPAIYDLHGRLQCLGGRALPFFRWLKKKAAKCKVLDCDFYPSTAMMVKRSALRAVGGWDYKDFPFHAEEVDLCLRIKRAGYRVVGYARAGAIHMSRGYVKVNNVTRAYYAARSRVKFFKKHYCKAFPLYLITINLAITLFYALLFLIEGKTAFLSAYIKGLADGIR